VKKTCPRNSLKVKSGELDGLIKDDFIYTDDGEKLFVVVNDPFNNEVETYSSESSVSRLVKTPYNKIVR